MRLRILEIIEKNSKLTAAEIAVMLGTTVENVQTEIERMRSERVILGYHTLINWEKTERDIVTAQIIVKVTPQRGHGFDQTAERIAQFPEVQGVTLFSGQFDLMVLVEGQSMKDVANFVAKKLAVMDSVVSCTTHFVLKKYKQNHIIFDEANDDDERPNILL